MKKLVTIAIAVAICVLPQRLLAEVITQNQDPLDSSMWPEMHKRLLNGQPVVFDNRIQVIAPHSAENSMNVPVKVDATAIGQVQRMVVFADLNPIPRILELEPGKAEPAISFNFKVQQATPLRAAAQDTKGVWHVGGVLLDASGGGCTQPSVGSASADWSAQLGNVTARSWPTSQGQRIRMRIMHPMDTGLADRIPAFYIEQLVINDSQGQSLANLKLFEPIAENPTLTLDLQQREAVSLFAVDNNGTRISARISPTD